MKHIVCILLIICSLTAFSQQKVKAQKTESIKSNGVDYLKFENLTSLSENPGFTGVLEKPAIRTHFGAYWLNMPDFPYTMSASYDQCVGKNNRFGVGAYFNRYQFNTKLLYTFDLAVSVKFRLGEHHSLRWGVSGLSYNKNIQNTERTGRTYEDMFSPFFGPWYPTSERKAVYNENYFDIKTGAWLTHEKYFAGFSILHIAQMYFGSQNQFENSESKNPDRLPVEFVFHAGYQLNAGTNLLITPVIELNDKFYHPANFTPSLNFTVNNQIIFGFSYRNMKFATVHVGARLYEHLNIIFSAGTPFDEDLQHLSKFALFETGISYIF